MSAPASRTPEEWLAAAIAHEAKGAVPEAYQAYRKAVEGFKAQGRQDEARQADRRCANLEIAELTASMEEHRAMRLFKDEGRDRQYAEMVMARKRGALLGLAVGDALGASVEFVDPGPRPFNRPLPGPMRDMNGGGFFHVKRGQVTDDTQMACCIAATLLETGHLDANNLAKRYLEWRPSAFDVGGTVSRVLELVANGENPYEAALRDWQAGGRRNAPNGSLMRTAPIALFFNDKRERVIAGVIESMITHADPRCVLACVGFNAAVSFLCRFDDLSNSGAPVNALTLGAVREEMQMGVEYLKDLRKEDSEYIERASASLESDLMAAQEQDPGLYSSGLDLIKHRGYVRVAFRLAFWELKHAPSFREGLLDVVNRGGDSDTNGAITGALLGASYGEDSIPEEWRSEVMEALQDGPPGPLRDEYHPKRLLELVDHEQKPREKS